MSFGLSLGSTVKPFFPLVAPLHLALDHSVFLCSVFLFHIWWELSHRKLAVTSFLPCQTVKPFILFYTFDDLFRSSVCLPPKGTAPRSTLLPHISRSYFEIRTKPIYLTCTVGSYLCQANHICLKMLLLSFLSSTVRSFLTSALSSFSLLLLPRVILLSNLVYCFNISSPLLMCTHGSR